VSLADRIVAFGVGRKNGPSMYVPPNHSFHNPQFPDDFTRSWEVAGALMEKCGSFDIDIATDGHTVTAWINSSFTGPAATTGSESLPHAIILACVEALET